MKPEPLISVIIPVYHVAAYLEACLGSVVAQTYKNLQILLIDDGSTDGSGALCDRWAAKDSRIRVIHQSNRGLSQARNAGLDAATGEYILFADSDDLLSPDLCRVLLEAAGAGAEIAICDAVHIFPNRSWQFSAGGRWDWLDSAEAIRRLWYQTHFLPSAWAKLYRRELFSQLRFTPGIRFEDVDILHELLFRAEKIACTDAKLYGYVHRENSITTGSFSARDLDILPIAGKILAFGQGHPQVQAAARAYAVTAALRVWLNAPRQQAFAQGIAQAETVLRTYGKAVMRDPNIRKKNRIALQLYFGCRPLTRLAYHFVNRWKS